MPARGAATKAATPAANNAVETPGATVGDAGNVTAEAGLSLLQLLAKSLEGGAAAASPTVSGDSTDSTAPAASTDSSDDTAGASGADQNAVALALFSQSFAAALGLPNVTPPAMSSTSAATGATTDGAAEGVTDATKSTVGSSIQDLVSLLTQDVAAESKGNSGTDSPQFDLAAAKPSAADTSAANAAAAGPTSLAHLGVASHFGLQRSQTDTNSATGELRSQVGTSAWNDELGGHLSWMTQQGLESGSLQLSPEHLGPVEVKISVQNGAASVWFGANQADTRAALEQALPRLREMFANQGMTLADSGVSREPPRNQPRSSSAQGVAAVSAIGGADVSVSSAVRMNLGLVDTYA